MQAHLIFPNYFGYMRILSYSQQLRIFIQANQEEMLSLSRIWGAFHGGVCPNSLGSSAAAIRIHHQFIVWMISLRRSWKLERYSARTYTEFLFLLGRCCVSTVDVSIPYLKITQKKLFMMSMGFEFVQCNFNNTVSMLLKHTEILHCRYLTVFLQYCLLFIPGDIKWYNQCNVTYYYYLIAYWDLHWIQNQD